jgi:hypothetical protein
VARWKKLLAILFLVIAITAGGAYVVPKVIDLVGRGRRLSDTSPVNPDLGDADDPLLVEDDPDKLVNDAAEILGRPVDRDALAASRMVRSEEGDANDATKRYLVHVALNDAARKGWTLFQVLTYSTKPTRNGYFGRQKSRRYSTVEDSYERDLVLAEEAIADHYAGNDPTAGAWHFYHKQLTEVIGIASYQTVVDNWGKEGAYPMPTLPGSPSRLVFFGPTGDRSA